MVRNRRHGVGGTIYLVDIWEDLQFTYHFEGLLVFCAGKKNTLADIASRVDRTEVEQTMLDEIQRQELGPRSAKLDFGTPPENNASLS